MSALRAAILGSLLWEIAVHLSLAQGQQPSGFINIDCGCEIESYVDLETGFTFHSDSKIMEFGEIKNLTSTYMSNYNGRQPRYLSKVRTFPKGKRNCYTLQPVIPRSKYLIRPHFLYGNFDGFNSFPQFDLYLENKFMQTVGASVSEWIDYEFFVMATRNYLTLCLCKTNDRDPFISAIELRPLPGDAIYPVVNATVALNNLHRDSFGSQGQEWYRYPKDAFDRFWLSPLLSNGLSSINTSANVSFETDPYMPPLVVMQIAMETTGGMEWSPSAFPQDSYFFMCIHFAELKKLEANQTREFYITLDGLPFYGPMRPSYLKATNVCSSDIYRTDGNHLVVLNPTKASTLSPILNAIELYSVAHLSNSATDDKDVSALLETREKYQITKPWTGDPCLPLNYSWEGLLCNNDTSSLRVISLDLSNSGLSGDIPTSLANLTAIVSINLARNNLTGTIPYFLANLTQLRDLDLSGNSLTGSIPDFFANLMQLAVLDLSDNDLNGSVPDALLHKKQSGSLTLRILGNQQLCSSGACDEIRRKNSKGFIVGLSVSAASVVFFLLLASSIIFIKKKNGEAAQTVEKNIGPQAFTFSEVDRMTNNFRQKVGEGGYGPVFYGHLSGQDVAVKILSDKSRQGSKEFYNEIAMLSRIHHRNLVSFLGYCEAEKMILVYEYLSKGDLREILSGKTEIGLNWNQRLQVALGAAQGLEYLHSGCKPAIIHRDVKSSNILLNDNLEAKLSDFGLSKSGMADGVSHLTTAIMGTPGYLDPEYSSTNWLNEKSDVYSFGVVLLELISGQQPVIIDRSGERVHVAEWARLHLLKGNHENVADPNLEGSYNVPSFWRVADTALECTGDERIKRPSMNNVVIELKEAIALCNVLPNCEVSDGVAQQNSEAFISSKPIADEEIQAIHPAAR
ncbi:unnamed protein product [Victoria cruziana]